MHITEDPFFLPVESGERFCVWRAPRSGPVSGIIVHLPAFAEEMNKARHVTARAARALACEGYGVLVLDLLGCGDSPGDFGDARWDTWIEDAAAAAQWARARGAGPLWLWTLRAGALLAPPVLDRLREPASLLLWQPVLSGRLHLTQFLRLSLAGSVLGQRGEGSGTRQLLTRLSTGEAVDVAGYTLSPLLVEGLAGAEFPVPLEGLERVVWLEVDPTGRCLLVPSSEASVNAMRQRGVRLDTRVVNGPGFWQALELEECPALIEATTSMLAAR